MSEPMKLIVTHSCCTYLAFLVVIFAAILSSEGIPTPEAKRSNRSESTEMRTTTAQRAETDQATKEEGGYSSTLATELSSSAQASRSQALTTQETTTEAHSTDSTSTSAATRRSLQNTTSSFFTTGFNTTHSPGGNTEWNAETRSSPRTGDVTETSAAHPMTVTTTDQPDNFVTPEVTNRGTSHSNTSKTATVSTASGTSSIFSSTESTQRGSTVDNVSSTGTEQTDNPTELIPLEAPVTPTLDTTVILLDELGDNVAQLIDSSSTPYPNSSPKNGSMDLRNQNPGTTPILVVVFGLITIIPLAIFFHCRVRRGGFKMFTSKSKKQDADKAESGDTHENSKPGHQRNTSISSIKLKENSTLLGNELPLDVNMNKPAPTPPFIVITPPPDVTIESSFGAQQARKKKRRRKQHNLPDTQLWFPDDGSEETPYFVTDNVPLPVSLV